MAIVASDIKFLLSAPVASAGYTMPGSPGNSLGIYASTTQLSTASGGLDNLFTDLTGAENAADQVDYACVFVWNSNGTHDMLTPYAWLPSGLLGSTNTATFAVGADPILPSALGSAGAQAVGIANSTLAPSGVTTWAGPSTISSNGIALPNIPAGDVAAVWIRRTANGAAGLNTFVLDITCDTLA
jgi:hypothetical protein